MVIDEGETPLEQVQKGPQHCLLFLLDYLSDISEDFHSFF